MLVKVAEPEEYEDDEDKDDKDEEDYDVADQVPPPLYRGKDKESVAEAPPVSTAFLGIHDKN
jgi:hypothetical protein